MPEDITPPNNSAGPHQGAENTGPSSNADAAFSQADVERIVRERLTRERAKYSDYSDLKAKAQRLDELEESQRTETERQVGKAASDAATKARTETRLHMGQRLVRAELKAEAAGKVADVDAVLDDLDLAKFVGEDGEPDTRAIKAFVTRLTKLAPAEKPAPPFNGGPRTTAETTDMNTLIRQRAGLG